MKGLAWILAASLVLVACSPKSVAEPVASGGSGSEVVTGLEVGNLAPDFKTVDTTGKNFSLADYKGQVVVLDYWALW